MTVLVKSWYQILSVAVVFVSLAVGSAYASFLTFNALADRGLSGKRLQ
ncbi:hypothetical protein ABH922_003024 [Rhodococcus sp. 27YEA15]